MKKVIVRPRAQPAMGRIAIPPRYSRWSDYPSNGLDPQKLARIFRQADDGDVSRQMQLFEEMEEKDPHLFSQLQTRKNAVTGLDYEVVPFGEEARDQEIAAFVSEQIGAIRNFDSVLLELLDAIGKGISISEIIWRYQNGAVAVEEIIPIHQKLLLWDQDDRMKLITNDAPTGRDLIPNKFIVHRYRARSGHPSRAGVLRVCAWMYLFKNYSVKDWVAFAEVYGMPLRLGKYDAAASEDDRNKLMQALVQLGSDAAGMIPATAAIEFIEANKTSSSDVFERLARYCDEQTSKAILGQTLTSDSGGGSYAQSKTHNEVRHDLTFADCAALESTLRDDLIRPLVLFNFGETSRLPSIKFDCEIPEDLKLLAEIFSELSSMGVPLPLSHIYERFGIPAPRDGEAVTARQNQGFDLPLKAFVNKETPELTAASDYQKRIDALGDRSIALSADLFEQVFRPVRELALKAGSLEELRRELEDQQTVNELFEESCSDKLTGLLADAMLAADLAGRLRAHG